MTRPRANAARLADDLAAMIAIPSVNPFGDDAVPGRREREMAEDLLTRFAALGLESRYWDVALGRPNVWGRLKGTGGGPTVMLAGHMDTVGVDGYPEGHKPRIADGRVYGRGACDMKAALACYLETVRMIQETGSALRGDLIIAGICDEENLMIGSTDWGRTGPRADFGIIGEPTGLRICPAHKGQLCVFLRTEGMATHSSRPELGVNAVEHMARIIVQFAGLNVELQENGPRHPLCGTGRFSMNVIRGGTLASAIPDFCELEVDRRFLPGERTADIIAEYRARLDDLSAKVPHMKASISTPSLEIQPLDIPRTNPMVRALERAVRTVCKAPSEIAAFPGGTDAPNMGFPCVICGPGDLAQAHGVNEFVDIRQMKLASEVYFTTILDLNNPRT